MSLLLIVSDEDLQPKWTLVTCDGPRIAKELELIGLTFKQVPKPTAVTETDDSRRRVITSIANRLGSDSQGWQTENVIVKWDVKDIDAQNELAISRARLRIEHFHQEDEVWLFLSGSSSFYVKHDNSVYIVVCNEGDVIRIPAERAHWFDMGSKPSFEAIRFFLTSPGFVGTFVRDCSLDSYPDLDELGKLATQFNEGTTL